MDTFMGKFKGANQQYLNTTAGKLELIKNNAAEAAETIGKGLVDGFKILAGDQEGLGKVADIIQKIATNTADFFRGLAQGFKDLANMPVIKQLMQLAGLMLKIVYKTAGAFIDPFIKEGARSRSSALAPSSANEHLKALQAKINADKAAKAEKDAAKRQRELIKFQKDAAKQALKEKKLGYIFDMDQIQIIAALQKTKDEETRKRLELQLALLQGQTDEAQRLAGELAKIEGKNSQLALFLRTLPDAKNPFASWSDYLAALEKEAIASAKRIADAYANANKPNPSNPSSPSSPSFIGPLPIGATAPAVPSFTVPLPAGTNIYDFNTGKEITVNLNVTTDAGQQIDVNQSYTADGGSLTVRRNNPSWSLGTN